MKPGFWVAVAATSTLLALLVVMLIEDWSIAAQERSVTTIVRAFVVEHAMTVSVISVAVGALWAHFVWDRYFG